MWTADIKARIVGTRIESAVPVMLSGLGHQPTPELVATTTTDLLQRLEQLYAGPLEPLPGAVPLLETLRAAGVPVALVSSSYRVLVAAVVRRLELEFDLVLAGDEVAHAKPHPEPYRTACARLGVPSGAAVVLEDAPDGVASAEAAGCAVVAVPSVPGVVVDPGPRRLVVGSLAEVDVPRLQRLVTGPVA